MKKLFFTLLIVGAFLTSCNQSDEEASLSYRGGLLVLNGGYQTKPASLAFLKGGRIVEDSLFKDKNGRILGYNATSIVRNGSLGYIVLNGSNTVEAVSLSDFSSKGTIQGLLSPRYMCIDIASNTGYVSCWGDDTTPSYVAKINLNTYAVEDTFQVKNYFYWDIKPMIEGVAFSDGKLYAANNNDIIVAKIDVATRTLEDRFFVNDRPSALQISKDGSKIWILCTGGGTDLPEFATYYLHTGGRKGILLGKQEDSPSKMKVSPDETFAIVLYREGAYRVNLVTMAFLDTKIFAKGSYFNEVYFHPSQDFVFISANNGAQSTVYKYDFSGNLLDSAKSGGVNTSGILYIE